MTGQWIGRNLSTIGTNVGLMSAPVWSATIGLITTLIGGLGGYWLAGGEHADNPFRECVERPAQDLIAG